MLADGECCRQLVQTWGDRIKLKINNLICDEIVVIPGILWLYGFHSLFRFVSTYNSPAEFLIQEGKALISLELFIIAKAD